MARPKFTIEEAQKIHDEYWISNCTIEFMAWKYNCSWWTIHNIIWCYKPYQKVIALGDKI